MTMGSSSYTARTFDLDNNCNLYISTDNSSYHLRQYDPTLTTLIIDMSVNSSGSVRVNNNLICFFDGSKLYQYDTNLNRKWVVTPSDLTSYKTTSEVLAFDSSGFLISTISLNGITPT